MTSDEKVAAKRVALVQKVMAVFGVAAVLFLVLAGMPSQSKAAEPVTILTGSDPYYLPIIVAVENGYFKEQGLDVSHRMFPSGTDAMLAFRGIGAQFVASGDAPSLILWDGGDVVGVAPIYASSDNMVGVVRADLKSPAELKGKKLAVRKGSTADYFLTTYLTKNGLKPTDLTIINLSPPECVPAMSSGSIDGFFLWQPYPSLALKVMGNKARQMTTAKGYYLEQIYLTANRKFAESNPQTVQKVLAGLKKAVAFIKESPDKSAAIGARKLKTEPAVVMGLINTKPYSLQYGAANRDQLLELVKFLQEQGKLKTPLDVNKAFDPKYLRAVDSALVASH